MNQTASMKLSLRLQDIATSLDDLFKDITGERQSFVLIVQADDIAQYVANVKREDGKMLVESLLERWQKQRADIPAHYNPDLKPAQGSGHGTQMDGSAT